mmetsp:Transcript_22190/g.56474  ORF Transcript_22190/g.56474 Transcript_22190/m.56474 type:complete len:236 (-) Transcript_22190:538-1245(-)
MLFRIREMGWTSPRIPPTAIPIATGMAGIDVRTVSRRCRCYTGDHRAAVRSIGGGYVAEVRRHSGWPHAVRAAPCPRALHPRSRAVGVGSTRFACLKIRNPHGAGLLLVGQTDRPLLSSVDHYVTHTRPRNVNPVTALHLGLPRIDLQGLLRCRDHGALLGVELQCADCGLIKIGAPHKREGIHTPELDSSVSRSRGKEVLGHVEVHRGDPSLVGLELVKLFPSREVPEDDPVVL